MRVPLSTTTRHTFGNPRTFACGAEFCTNMVAWDYAQALSRVSGIWNTWIPRYLHMILHKIICLAYFIRWAIPDLSPVLVVSSQVGQKDAGKRKLSSPNPPLPCSLSNHQPCEKARTRRLPSSSSRRHSGIRLIQSRGENPARFFCPAALQLGFFSPLVGLDQIPVIFARKEVDLLSCAFRTSKYQLSQ